jgi:hypothetical protein
MGAPKGNCDDLQSCGISGRRIVGTPCFRISSYRSFAEGRPCLAALGLAWPHIAELQTFDRTGHTRTLATNETPNWKAAIYA